MNLPLFITGGPLTDEHAEIYIERQADHEILAHFHPMDYLLIIEPRQQGKTSLINHLMYQSFSGNIEFVYIDLTRTSRNQKGL